MMNDRIMESSNYQIIWSAVYCLNYSEFVMNNISCKASISKSIPSEKANNSFVNVMLVYIEWKSISPCGVISRGINNRILTELGHDIFILSFPIDCCVDWKPPRKVCHSRGHRRWRGCGVVTLIDSSLHCRSRTRVDAFLCLPVEQCGICVFVQGISN